jgi:RNA polymerase sigma factor (sigma-70 family)
VTIEVYTQVHRRTSHYDPQRGTPSAWLLTLTRSRAIDRLRIETLRRAHEESLDETATIASLLGDPEACSASSELRCIVQHALSRLTPEQREAIEIAYYAWALACVLITFLLDHMVPPGAVLLAGDDTVTEHPGPPRVWQETALRRRAVDPQLCRLSLGPQVGRRVCAREVAVGNTALGTPGVGRLPSPRVGSCIRHVS